MASPLIKSVLNSTQKLAMSEMVEIIFAKLNESFISWMQRRRKDEVRSAGRDVTSPRARHLSWCVVKFIIWFWHPIAFGQCRCYFQDEICGRLHRLLAYLFVLSMISTIAKPTKSWYLFINWQCNLAKGMKRWVMPYTIAGVYLSP
jgi:hypothetical protein